GIFAAINGTMGLIPGFSNYNPSSTGITLAFLIGGIALMIAGIIPVSSFYRDYYRGLKPE
ncbi:hypothetical protein ACFLZS_01835, partial [Patescibacteria group bacterium]